MNKYISGSLFIIISGLILLSSSCTPQSCLEETEAFLKVSFYNTTAKRLLAPAKLSVYGLGNDSAIYVNSTGIQPALLPLNASTDTTSFLIEINGTADTIRFIYSSYPHLISKECGYTFYHDLDSTRSFTRNAIIDIYYTKRNITTVNEENIRIFY